MFGGRAWGSQATDGFCWDVEWAASQGPLASQFEPVPATRSAGWRQGASGVTKELPQSRSGAAALSAQRAAVGADADPFSFDNAPLGNMKLALNAAAPAGLAGSGWRGRADSFLLSRQPQAAAQQKQTQPPQPAHKAATLPAAAARQPVTQPAPVVKPPVSAVALKPPATVTMAPAAGPSAAAQQAACSLSLERYLEFWQLLSKGSGRVQPLSDLERSILKAADLKQIMLVNGLNAGSRPKKEILEKLGQMQLFSPLCLLPSSAAATAASTPTTVASPAAGSRVQLDRDALAGLGTMGWVTSAALLPGAEACCGTCCTLPPVRIEGQVDGQADVGAAPAGDAVAALMQQLQQQLQPLSSHDAPSAGMAAAPARPGWAPTQPADSQVTMASLGAAACLHDVVQCSPAVGQQQRRQQLVHGASAVSQGPAAVAAEAATDSVGSGHTAAEEELKGGEEPLEPPEWLVQGIAQVAERSQGSGDAVLAHQLPGRRVCFVLLKDFDQSDPRGITDTLDAGVQEGQVVEAVGVDHDDDCSPGCTQRHAFYYVRVRASRSTAPLSRRAGRRLDLVVDLQQELRQLELDRLLGMGDAELQEAWVLLEPKQDDGEADEEQQQATAAAAALAQLPGSTAGAASAPRGAAGSIAGEWRTKRGGQSASEATAPLAKRQQTAGMLC